MRRSAIVAVIIGGAFASALNAQVWLEQAGAIPPASGVTSGSALASGNYLSRLKALSKGSWKTYLNNYTASAALKTSDGDLLVSAKRTSNGTYGSSTSYASFNLSEAARSAESVRISFNVQHVSDEVAVELGINISDWTTISVGVELRSAGLEGGTLSDSLNTRFKFGLLNLETDEWLAAEISDGSGLAGHLFDWTSDSWFEFASDEDGLMGVSFELGAEELALISEAGLALVIMTDYGSVQTGTELYVVKDFTLEVMPQIPEPAVFAAFFGLLALLCAAQRRRN